MNLGLIIGIISIIIIIIIVIIVVVILKYKNQELTNQESESANTSKSESETKLTLKSESESTNTSNQEIKTKINPNSNSVKPEEIVSENINAPKELSQAELLKAEIMKEVLQDQKADFDKTLEDELNMDNYFNDKINNYFNTCELSDELQNEKYTLITSNNIVLFKFIIPSYNPTNGAHFIYSITYWILKDKYDEFDRALNEVLKDIKLNNDVIEDGYRSYKNNEINKGHILFKTYTNTSTPSYQYERINKNLKKKFDIVYFINEDDISKIQLQKSDEDLCVNIYTYQGDIHEFAEKLDKDYKSGKIKKINVKPLNVEAYGISK